MEVDAFLTNALDPTQWLSKSVELRRSANALWESFFEAAMLWAAKTKDGVPDTHWREVSGYLTSAKLLYGLAVETALKAHLLRHSPESVLLKMSADGSGKVTDVEMKQFGVAMGSGHNLEQLAQRAGVFERDVDPLFQTDTDYHAIRDILRHLSDIVYWSGRYPVPVRSGESYLLSSDGPPQAFGHYLRDWLDVLLDRYQGTPPESSEQVFARMQKILDRVKAEHLDEELGIGS